MIKNILRKIIPGKILQPIKRMIFFYKTKDNIDLKYSGRSISDIFNEIYVKDEWGKGDEGKFKKTESRFYSGSGSYNSTAEEYIRFVDEFIKENNVKTITDIGCGDFNIGRQILELNIDVTYAGVDVVRQLIDYNNEKFANGRVHFYLLDTLKEPVPQSDLLLVRQVLQHLSNADITALTQNCFNNSKDILVTEHQLKAELVVKKNIDKATGANIRLGFGSGVYLDSYPFNYKWIKKLVVKDPDNSNCEIVTYLIKN